MGLLPALISLGLAGVAHAAVDPAVDPAAAGGSVEFSTNFFPTGTAPKVDLSRFEKGNYVEPGTYRGDVTLNQQWRARGDIVVGATPDSKNVVPCFTAAELTRYGIDLKKLTSDPQQLPAKPMPEGRFCAPLGDFIPGATAEFSLSDQSLTISVPQIYTLRNARGYVDPSQWDAGINAGVLNYNANVYRSSFGGRDSTSAYAGVNASLNLGSWHLNHMGSMNWTQGRGGHYQATATYAEHDIPSLQAQVVVGDTFTDGQLYDSMRLRGVRMYSDDRMLPPSQRGYAPVVRGVAETNARVRIKQNGYVIYETSVAPGPFVIDDLYPTGYGGDIQVEVLEADGRTKFFDVPYAAVPMLLRPGQNRWSVAAGQLSQLGLQNAPWFAQGTYQRGITNAVTAYGGTILGSNYQSFMAGAALNTSIGAFSADITHARNKVPGTSLPSTGGESIRLGYNKNVSDWGTNFAVAAYRYSTSGYVSFNDAAALRNAAATGQTLSSVPIQRNRADVTLTQSLGDDFGQLYASASRIDYWNKPGSQVNFSLGYSNRYKSLTYSLTAQRTRDSIQSFLPGTSPLDTIPGASSSFYMPTSTRRDTTLMFTASLPLGKTPDSPYVSTMLNHSQSGGSSEQASVSGTVGKDGAITYNASLGHNDASTSVNLNGQYNAAYGSFGAGYSHNGSSQQFYGSARGAVVAHGGGVTFAPTTGDTIALVHAAGAEGAAINGQKTVVDSRGYGVVTYLQPYMLNSITLDPKGTGSGVELKDTVKNVAPRAGSVVLLDYEISSGRALLVETKLADGGPIPFGADVLDGQGNSVGVAGQAGRLFIRGVESSAELTVRWGEGEADACRIHVDVLPKAKGAQNDMETVRAGMCRPLQVATPAAPLATEVPRAGAEHKAP